MARLSKCKYCNELIEKEDLIIKIESKNNKEYKIKLHKKCETEYIELMEYKSNEIKWFEELYLCVKDTLGYSLEQTLPNYLITRLQDLRNGTIMRKGVGRVVKTKEGYPYQVIIDTLLTQSNSIEWAFKNKTFKNEKNKINYMMAIVESNINDSYILFMENGKKDSTKERNDLLSEEKFIKKHEFRELQQKQVVEKKSSGISKFLDEDDF